MEIKIHKLKIFRYIKPKSNIREYNKNSELHSREHPGSSSDMSPQSSLPSHTCKQHPRHILHKAASIAPALPGKLIPSLEWARWRFLLVSMVEDKKFGGTN